MALSNLFSESHFIFCGLEKNVALSSLRQGV